MKTICIGTIGIVLILVGIVLGLYVGVWLCFIGGSVQLIEEMRAEHLNAMGVAIGVTRIVLAGFLGCLSAIVCILPGWFLLLRSSMK
jgi:hypothetical protein